MDCGEQSSPKGYGELHSPQSGKFRVSSFDILMISLSQLVALNARLAGVRIERVSEGAFPLHTPRGRLGVYRCRLGSSSVSTLAAAIAQAEGANVPGSIAQRANNPGNLHLGDIGYSTITESNGTQVTIFPTPEAGQAALEAQIQSMISGGSSLYSPDMTIDQVSKVYTGGSSIWGQNIAKILGVTPDTNFASLIGADGGTITPHAGTLADVAATIEQDTGVSLPAWAPYAVAGLGAYLALDAFLL